MIHMIWRLYINTFESIANMGHRWPKVIRRDLLKRPIYAPVEMAYGDKIRRYNKPHSPTSSGNTS